jgi:glutathione peroxidase
LAILQEKFKSRGFSVLAFPTNDFHQELGSNEEIQEFVSKTFDDKVTFPMFGLSCLKDNVVYQQLQRQLPDSHVKQNFFKYLVDRNGKAVKMFNKKEDPLTLTEDIEKLLDESNGSRQHKLVTQ